MPQSNPRKLFYYLLIVVSTTMSLARIASVESRTAGPKKQHTPFLSANDRSRWCTTRALVDEGVYQIDSMIDGHDPNWKTIDLVRHRGADGKQHYYSSKPPLLPTLLAGEYWLLKKITGASLADSPFYIGRIMLVLTNVIPLLLYFVFLAGLIEHQGRTDFGRIYVMSVATFATLLTTFSVTINNHLVAAVSVLFATTAAIRIWYHDEKRLGFFVLAGLAAGFATANELPALSFLVLLGAGLFWKAPAQTLFGYGLGVLLVATAFFGTNYAAHRDLRPPYAHRHDGPVLLVADTSLSDWIAGPGLPAGVRQKFLDAGHPLSAAVRLEKRVDQRGWKLIDPTYEQQYALLDKGPQTEVRSWDNWYEYDGSYWTETARQGVDRGESSKWNYAFHVLLGHHGVFSLTPVWILTLVGLAVVVTDRERGMPALATLTLILTFVCLAFYIGLRPVADRNYGGVNCGFRWMIWLTPLWVLGMIPILDWIAQYRGWRIVAFILLACSVFSSVYPGSNPWSHPWLYQYWKLLGWIGYS